MADNLPLSIASSTLELLPGLSLTVHVLDNGMRVVDEESMRNFIEWLSRGDLELTDELAILLAKHMMGTTQNAK